MRGYGVELPVHGWPFKTFVQSTPCDPTPTIAPARNAAGDDTPHNIGNTDSLKSAPNATPDDSGSKQPRRRQPPKFCMTLPKGPLKRSLKTAQRTVGYAKMRCGERRLTPKLIEVRLALSHQHGSLFPIAYHLVRHQITGLFDLFEIAEGIVFRVL